MIRIIPRENRSVVIHEGRLKLPLPSDRGDPAVIIEGQRVPYEELDAWYRERMIFDWRGQPFHLDKHTDDQMLGTYLGNDLTWPEEVGLEGSRYNGWLCNVPEVEVENVRIEKDDLLKIWRYRQTFKVEPPEDLFRDVRPATSEEWTKA